MKTPHDEDDSLRVHMIDVGQGDSILVESPDGETMLVDSGPLYNSDKILDYLDAHDVDHLDHLVATHDDADHIGGHPDIIEKFGSDRIGTVHGPNMPGREEKETGTKARYNDVLIEHEIEENLLEEGSSDIDLSGVEVDVFNPSMEVDSTKYNENSLVMQISNNEQSVLLAGDAVGEAETHLVDAYSDQLSDVDVLKAAHHGADNGTGPELLMACDPETICFSHGAQNRHDHPTRETLAQSRFADADVVSTAVHGSTTFSLDGEEMVTVEHERAMESREVDDVAASIYYVRANGRDQLDPSEGVGAADLPDETPRWVEEAAISTTDQTIDETTDETAAQSEAESAEEVLQTDEELFQVVQTYADEKDMSVEEVLQSMQKQAEEAVPTTETDASEEITEAGEEGIRIREELRSMTIENGTGMSKSEGTDAHSDTGMEKSLTDR